MSKKKKRNENKENKKSFNGPGCLLFLVILAGGAWFLMNHYGYELPEYKYKRPVVGSGILTDSTKDGHTWKLTTPAKSVPMGIVILQNAAGGGLFQCGQYTFTPNSKCDLSVKLETIGKGNYKLVYKIKYRNGTIVSDEFNILRAKDLKVVNIESVADIKVGESHRILFEVVDLHSNKQVYLQMIIAWGDELARIKAAYI